MKSMLACCLNWKVVAGVGAVAMAVLVLAPSAVVTALPLLILAICPLSMIAMMVAMRGMGGSKSEAPASPSQPQLKERLAQLAAEQRQLEAQLADEPVASAAARVSADGRR